MSNFRTVTTILLMGLYSMSWSQWITGQEAVLTDPIAGAQSNAAGTGGNAGVLPGRNAGKAMRAIPDPVSAAQVLAAAEKTFPNLAGDLANADLLQKAISDPRMRGNLRGRIAEADWIRRNSGDGWKSVRNPTAPQNDATRLINGKREGAQVKVYEDWRKYLRSMREDNLAERFVLPDDHYDLVYQDLETRRLGALRGGLTEKAAYYAQQQKRLTKMGRTFEELDAAIEASAKHYGRIARALRAGSRSASFVGITLMVLDGGLAVYEVATGKAEVDELVTRVGSVVASGSAAWVLGQAAATAAVAAGATGAVPVAAAIVISTGTYLVVDWAIDKTVDSLRVGYLSAEDVARIWPDGARGVPLQRLQSRSVESTVLEAE